MYMFGGGSCTVGGAEANHYHHHHQGKACPKMHPTVFQIAKMRASPSPTQPPTPQTQKNGTKGTPIAGDPPDLLINWPLAKLVLEFLSEPQESSKVHYSQRAFTQAIP